ncbi:MAG TPA: phosphonate ABC transporter, permease protein PhnE [Calditerricola sp.]
MPRRNVKRFGVILLLAAAAIWAARGTEVNLAQFRNLFNSVDLLRQFFPLDWTDAGRTFAAALVTLQMAFLGTLTALLVAFPAAFLAARNTAPSHGMYAAVRGALNVLRAVPEIVIALLLVPMAGLGPFPGVLTIFLHNVGVLGKLISELIEAADPGPPEAVASTGARRLLVYLYGIVPQIWPNVLSQYFYRFEVAIRASLFLGLIGAGGIGEQLLIHFKLFQYSRMAVDILAIIVLVMAVDALGGVVRKRVI